MHRCLEPEWLDTLPPQDPQAVGSRRDLRVLNAWMGNAATIARALQRAFLQHPPRTLADLGAGDGTFLLQVAARLPQNWEAVHVVLVDRHNALSLQTCKAFERRGWTLELLQADVLEWLKGSSVLRCDAMVTNLFLHHFAEASLRELMGRAAERTRGFVAVEPQRSAWVHAFSRWVWLLGCNAVTRHDAPISVEAGFTDGELSRHWPSGPGWSLREGRAGFFSHLFVATQPSS